MSDSAFCCLTFSEGAIQMSDGLKTPSDIVSLSNYEKLIKYLNELCSDVSIARIVTNKKTGYFNHNKFNDTR